MTLQERINAIPYWYHRIEMPDGTVTPGWSPINADRYCIPKDMTGMRVLDIGAWDGYWTWEALKRGAAEVVAIDDFSDGLGTNVDRSSKWETFDICREAFGFDHQLWSGNLDGETADRYVEHQDLLAKVQLRGNLDGETADRYGWQNLLTKQRVFRYQMSIYDMREDLILWPTSSACGGPVETMLGRFDVVFFFGTIYHLKHPLLALEKISEVCRGALYVETASLDECSPYRGGIGHGFNQNEMVMEFYPGAEYCANPSNWWAPTLQCLGAMMASVGFKEIEAWPLVEKPTTINECRGFASGTKDASICPANHPNDIPAVSPIQTARVAAVMSVPRLGFQDNMTCAFEALTAMRIPLINVQGAFWGQCLERGMQQLIDSGIDLIVTIDYDTVFSKADLQSLLRLAMLHPEAAAVVPVQKGRGTFPILMSMKSKTGQMRSAIPLTEFQDEVVPIASGHFGLTVLRVEHLMEIPHPWFWDQPNADGQWGPGRVDADIWFWKQLEKYKKTTLLACRIPVGHIEAMINWPDTDMQPVYQHTGEFRDGGKPVNAWK